MRILGIDYGDARIGLALSDETQFLASPLKTVTAQSMRKNIDVIAEIAALYECESIVVGLPLNMDGTEGDRASKTRSFGKVLGKVSSLPVDYWDERLTSLQADEWFEQSGVRKEKRKLLRDQAAAVAILQSYLDSKVN